MGMTALLSRRPLGSALAVSQALQVTDCLGRPDFSRQQPVQWRGGTATSYPQAWFLKLRGGRPEAFPWAKHRRRLAALRQRPSSAVTTGPRGRQWHGA